ELTQRYEIKTLHYTEIVALENDSVLIRSKMAPVISGKTPDSYDYIFDIDNKYAFRTHTETQNKIILRQMSGIAVASLIILALLIFSYIYLMRTILKQKTLEEIKRDFTNNMTHELKTPISVAYAANDVLLNYSSEKNESRRKDYLYIIKEQLQHLSGLVEQILSMSRDEQKEISLKIESINLRSLCRQLISEYRLKTEKPTEFTLAITDSFSINADRIHFYNILSNLIDNSLKYSGPSVHISISAKKENKKTIIEVIDNGNGIKKEQQERIFDKFYRVPTGNIHDIKGYGLGLYYIKRLIETHNGKITVISEYGKGSKFIIEWTL
ncbi:MAG: sensor histidine kinase, partial [Barnesiella sp.]